VQPKPPQGILPLTWQAPDLGYYGFRNSWEGKDDVIVQVASKSYPIRGWSGAHAGSFRVWGLGHAWAFGPTSRERCRALENVVMLPDTPINESACGRCLDARAEPDGSGIVSVDLGDVYASRDENNKEDLYEYYGGGRNAAAFKDSGVRGLRSVAVDYSGKSGAPCLMAIVDRIQGGRSKVWTWQLSEGGLEGYGAKAKTIKVPDAKAVGNGFIVTQPGGATMRGTFVAPAKARVNVGGRSGVFHNAHSGDMKYTIHGIFADGEDPAAGDFFVVVTFQRGEPPAVTIEGEGIEARAIVGKRTVRFDGVRIVIE
jgi:hypothetical protein